MVQERDMGLHSSDQTARNSDQRPLIAHKDEGSITLSQCEDLSKNELRIIEKKLSCCNHQTEKRMAFRKDMESNSEGRDGAVISSPGPASALFLGNRSG